MTRAPSTKPKLLVFVIAYYAESTLRQVLERIPSSVFADNDCEILVVDDASEDRTYAIGREWQAAHPELRMTVLRNEYNQGYGGNQKVGYAYAIEFGFDYVAMVHGDGQYAPEELPRLLEPLKNGAADAVFGSRMLERFGALKGGMPLYKYVGNALLNRIENHTLELALTDYHSGYLLYGPRALSLPFSRLSDSFDFDLEVIASARARGLAVGEAAVPTHYGDEISHLNPWTYGLRVLRVLWNYRRGHYDAA